MSNNFASIFIAHLDDVNPDNPKQVLIECEDGNTYTHHDIK